MKVFKNGAVRLTPDEARRLGVIVAIAQEHVTWPRGPMTNEQYRFASQFVRKVHRCA